MDVEWSLVPRPSHLDCLQCEVCMDGRPGNESVVLLTHSTVTSVCKASCENDLMQ